MTSFLDCFILGSLTYYVFSIITYINLEDGRPRSFLYWKNTSFIFAFDHTRWSKFQTNKVGATLITNLKIWVKIIRIFEGWWGRIRKKHYSYKTRNNIHDYRSVYQSSKKTTKTQVQSMKNNFTRAINNLRRENRLKIYRKYYDYNCHPYWRRIYGKFHQRKLL